MDVHGVLIAFIAPAAQTGAADRVDPFRIGLDHLALAIADAGELEGLRQQLDAAGVPNHGIAQDPATGTTYIRFYGPYGTPGSCTPCR